ncbi:F0F1 ATP synthase subunit delta [Paenibacillus sp. GSMTC-2017]|uniref:F0F1 ATP synthase subunit delta n=1 Tax=Paenibacillus sp. GSMTC-2017 TaxID=2794350 RepID=UPI0018D74DD0|nr:F0F1 ATP synthase subunit delta [Paenibacillus sp. GSMTC-2017]MBH5320565.1 F0F1 ATP synthase subunit delta [Paenibacillus sp. GSMTC-2017]
MSRDTVVAKRYAKALFELASAAGKVSEVEDQLKLIADALKQDEETVKFLSLPTVAPEGKIALLKAVFGDNVSELVYNTLHVLVTRRRQSIIGDVYEAYTKIAGEALGQAHATVYSAKELTDQELADVSAQFGSITGKKIIAQQIVEPALLGGLQVRIGDRLYDGSLSGKLDRLQKSLNSKAL